MDLVIDGVRWVLWILVKGSLFLIDSVYNIIRPILSFDIGANPTVWKWWEILVGFLFLFTLLRIVSMMLKATIDEEYALKLNGLQIFYRTFAIAFIIAMTPVVIKEFTAFTSVVMDNVADSFVVENNFANTKPKQMIQKNKRSLINCIRNMMGCHPKSSSVPPAMGNIHLIK